MERVCTCAEDTWAKLLGKSRPSSFLTLSTVREEEASVGTCDESDSPLDVNVALAN